MDEKELKTSPKQRVFIIIIVVIMLGSIIASYAAIVMNGGSSPNNASTDSADTPEVDQEKVAKYQAEYDKKMEEFKEASKKDYEKFSAYRSEVKAYNEASANNSGLQTRDLKEGSGRELTDGDYNYLAYYIGWCADESVFDSSFDNNENPTSFKGILDASQGLIEGWNTGVVGMKIGGIREITIPGELAYGDSMEICGGKNKPLKFIIMTKAKEGDLATLASDLDTAYMRLQYANYGMDYDEMVSGQE